VRDLGFVFEARVPDDGLMASLPHGLRSDFAPDSKEQAIRMRKLGK
jgi:hypothetical protein